MLNCCGQGGRGVSVVDITLTGHFCGLGSNPCQDVWQGSGCLSRFGRFPKVHFSSTTLDHIMPTSVPSRTCLYSPFHSSLPFEHLHYTRRPCILKI